MAKFKQMDQLSDFDSVHFRSLILKTVESISREPKAAYGLVHIHNFQPPLSNIKYHFKNLEKILSSSLTS